MVTIVDRDGNLVEIGDPLPNVVVAGPATEDAVHTAGVKSRTMRNCIVGEPIIMTVDGKDIEISLADAKFLHHGLGEAINRVENSETNVRQCIGETGHSFVWGKSGNGMSFPQSRFGERPILFPDQSPPSKTKADDSL